MERFFNTTGPCDPAKHYMLPAQARMPNLLPMVRQEAYFVLHAARQTGKTTAMMSLAATLRGLGYAAVWATLEQSQGVDDVARAESLWVESLATWAGDAGVEIGDAVAAAESLTAGNRLAAFLRAWAAAEPRPIVLLLDEADVVTGTPLISLLRQLRAGFMQRGVGKFPVSVGLIGMRDLRDYLTVVKDGVHANPGSPFNIKAASVTLRSFHRQEVAELFAQHTEATGQVFTEAAADRVFELTAGQPFLVNWLAKECVEQLVTDRAVDVDVSHIDDAKERLILARTTHLDALAERLKEPRVVRIVQPVLVGQGIVDTASDDFDYCVDLGLVGRSPDGIVIANPVYREVLGRVLTVAVQDHVPRPWWRWLTPDGRLDFDALVDAFLAWWRENEGMLRSGMTTYPEAVPQLAFMGFLQRVVNGGGRITREFAAGRGRIDLFVEYGADRFVVELKRVTRHDSPDTAVARGIEQTRGYMDTVGADAGWLIVFDVRDGVTWEERLWRRDAVEDGAAVRVRGA